MFVSNICCRNHLRKFSAWNSRRKNFPNPASSTMKSISPFFAPSLNSCLGVVKLRSRIPNSSHLFHSWWFPGWTDNKAIISSTGIGSKYFVVHFQFVPLSPGELWNVSLGVAPHNPLCSPSSSSRRLMRYLAFPFSQFRLEWKLMMFCQFRSFYPFILLATISTLYRRIEFSLLSVTI